MLDFKTIWAGEHIEVVSPKDVHYECVNEKDIVIALPIVTRKDGKKLVGIRYEYCPSYFIKDDKVRNYYTVLSGKIEDGEKPEAAVLRELREESGVIAENPNIIEVCSNIPICKSTNMRAFIYVVEIGKFKKEVPKGDGTRSEELSKTIWMDVGNIYKLLDMDNVDFLVCSLLCMYVWKYNLK